MRSWTRLFPARRKPLVFSGTSNPELAQRIADCLGTRLGPIEHETFGNGETYCRFGQSIRGADVFLVQSCSRPVNDHLLELLLMIQAARLASAHRITAVMPWFPYSRQDKKSASREPISARLVADLLETAGADRVLTMDLHAGQIQGFFEIPVGHMTALPLFADHFRHLAREGARLAVVSPDLGRVKLARRLSHALGSDLAVVTKTRPHHDVAEVAEVADAVDGKTVVMGDDMIVTGNTLVSAAEALLAAGAVEVHAFATHGLLAEDALDRLQRSALAEIAVTDSVRISGPLPPKLTVLSIADVLAETIGNVFANRSVAAQFTGQELFGDQRVVRATPRVCTAQAPRPRLSKGSRPPKAVLLGEVDGAVQLDDRMPSAGKREQINPSQLGADVAVADTASAQASSGAPLVGLIEHETHSSGRIGLAAHCRSASTQRINVLSYLSRWMASASGSRRSTATITVPRREKDRVRVAAS